MPTRVTKNSKRSFDNIITETNMKSKLLSTTISDHFILTADFLVSSVNIKSIQSPVLLPNLKTTKTDKALIFIFELDQNIKQNS